MNMTRFDSDARTDFLQYAASRRLLLQRLAGGAVAAGVAGMPGRMPRTLAQATPDPAATAPLDTYRFRLGELDVRVLDDGAFAFPVDWFATNARPRALSEAIAEGDLPSDVLPIRLNTLLIDTGDQLVLVDTGFGTINPEAGKLPLALRAAGIVPEQIDLVILTHFHPDHIAGTIDSAGKPTFPNARYLANKTEYDYWQADPSLVELMIPDELKALARQVGKEMPVLLEEVLELVEPGDEVAPGVTVLAAYGHSPGQLAVEVASEGERLLHVADAAGVPALHLSHPEWFMKLDHWPAQAIMTRNELFDRAAEEDLLVLGYHFPFPGLGKVQADGDDWQWEPLTNPSQS